MAAVLVVAALGAAIVRRRFSAAVFLGLAGYAMAALFVLWGAPDLALTQAAVSGTIDLERYGVRVLQAT